MKGIISKTKSIPSGGSFNRTYFEIRYHVKFTTADNQIIDEGIVKVNAINKNLSRDDFKRNFFMEVFCI